MSKSFSRISGRIAMAMALSWTLIPGARAEAPTPPAASPVKAIAKQAPMVSSGKNLNTIPEDGMGDETWLSGATRIVRDLQAARPKEDMVICIAGCIPSMNRVVFTQEALPPLPKPADTMSDAAPNAGSETPADAKAAEASPDAQKAEADKKPEFVPTMSEPKTDAPPATEAPPTADAPPSDAPPEPK